MHPKQYLRESCDLFFTTAATNQKGFLAAAQKQNYVNKTTCPKQCQMMVVIVNFVKPFTDTSVECDNNNKKNLQQVLWVFFVVYGIPCYLLHLLHSAKIGF